MIAYFMEFTNWLYKVLHAGVGGYRDLEAGHGTVPLRAGAGSASLGRRESGSAGGTNTPSTSRNWPEFDESLIHEETFTLVIQVNGKVRDTIEASVALDEEGARELALESERVQQFLNGQEVKLVKFVPGRLINVVVG